MKGAFSVALLLLALASSLQAAPLNATHGSIQCLDEQGSPVDWWFGYKLPDGVQYAYTDSTDKSTDPLTPSKFTLQNGALAHTLKQLYDQKNDVAYVLYNDERPPKAGVGSSGGAHAKGVVLAGEEGGFWLVHSVPRFPDLSKSAYSFPEDEEIYGQHFLCVSLGAKQLDGAAGAMRYNHLDMFATNLPSGLKGRFPGLAALIDEETENGSHVYNMTSAAGQPFTVFAKSPSWGEDLGENLVEPFYNAPFQWFTWRRKPALDSFCTPKYQYNSINVLAIKIGGTQFHYTRDHSKLGVSAAQERSVVCAGDINRMSSQRKRGGGTVCITSDSFWQRLSGCIASADSCK